ncbi:MAG: tetratricopeptide repeat protein [Gammaproteobacteria bacterium]|jgi:tetratricopeptide (TPR) repeat protein
MDILPGNRLILIGVFLLLIGVIETASGQVDWPHGVRDWSDAQFQARVQGVYDWKGSGPDRLQTLEYTEVPIDMYQLSTVNRDLNSFPPRDTIDPELQYFPPPKDWVDRKDLILSMRGSGEIDATFFEEKLDESAGPDTYFLMGNIYFLKNRLVDAIRQYEMATDRFSRFRLAYQNMAFAYINLGDCDNALTTINKAISLGAFGVRVKGLQGYCALQQGNYVTAADALAISRMLDSENSIWLELQIQALIGAGHYMPARNLLSSHASRLLDSSRILDYLISIAQSDSDWESLHSLLEVKRIAGQLTSKENATLQRLRASQGLPVSRGEVGSLLSVMDADSYIADSAQIMSELIDNEAWEIASIVGDGVIESLAGGPVSADSANIIYLQASILTTQGQIEEGSALLDELLRAYPIHCEALILRAEQFNQLDELQQSHEYFNRAIRSSSSCSEKARLEYADVLIQREDYSHAFELYQTDRRQKEIAGIIDTAIARKLVEALARLTQASVQ